MSDPTMAPGTRGVLVTGASTGIGEACARHLDRQGWWVFAGVRSATDAERLRAGSSDRLVPVTLDITDEAQIGAAVATVEETLGGRGLHGVVNNAGVARGGPVEYLPLDEWRQQLEINVVGQVAVTKATLDLVRRAGGRIVFIGSMSGRVAAPFMAPYSASKHAIEAVGESLAEELRPWGIHVAVVEPGAVATPIWGKGRATIDRLDDELPPEAHERYPETFRDFRQLVDEAERRGIPPQKVADVVEHALTSARPRRRYPVGPDARAGAVLDRLLPDSTLAWVLRRVAR